MIKQEVIEQILDRPEFIERLAVKYGVSTGTVVKWYKYKHPKILNYNLMVLVSEELNTTIDQLCLK